MRGKKNPIKLRTSNNIFRMSQKQTNKKKHNKKYSKTNTQRRFWPPRGLQLCVPFPFREDAGCPANTYNTHICDDGVRYKHEICRSPIHVVKRGEHFFPRMAKKKGAFFVKIFFFFKKLHRRVYKYSSLLVMFYERLAIRDKKIGLPVQDQKKFI